MHYEVFLNVFVFCVVFKLHFCIQDKATFFKFRLIIYGNYKFFKLYDFLRNYKILNNPTLLVDNNM